MGVLVVQNAYKPRVLFDLHPAQVLVPCFAPLGPMKVLACLSLNRHCDQWPSFFFPSPVALWYIVAVSQMELFRCSCLPPRIECCRFYSIDPLWRHPAEQDSAHFSLDRLANLHDAPGRADVHALSQVEALLDEPGGARVPSPGEALEVLELGGDGPGRPRDDLEVLHDGLVVAVLEADPEALARDGRGAERLGLVRGQRRGVRGYGAAARDERQETRPLERQEQVEIRRVPRRARQAQARLGGVLQVRAQMCKILKRHFVCNVSFRVLCEWWLVPQAGLSGRRVVALSRGLVGSRIRAVESKVARRSIVLFRTYNWQALACRRVDMKRFRRQCLSLSN